MRFYWTTFLLVSWNSFVHKLLDCSLKKKLLVRVGGHFYIHAKDLLVIYMFKSNFDANYPNNIFNKNYFYFDVSKHKSILSNLLLNRINSLKLNSTKIDYFRRQTKHILSNI
jgi:hypothetical protein